MFTQQDKNQFDKRGISEAEVQRQLHFFETGFPALNLDRPATAGDGIAVPGDAEISALAASYDQASAEKKIVKFVPASGAATRMFKDMFAFLNTSERSKAVDDLCARRRDLPFFDLLAPYADGREATGGDRAFIAAMLGTPGLDYGALPKALVHFHRYEDGVRTSLEEHLVEGAMYACSAGRKVYLHFTVSPQHLEGFRRRIAETAGKYERRFGVTYDISYSEQSPATDTIAVNPDNTPFRLQDGSILFRPGGHGALLSNLNAIDADLVFIKNIDNVVPDHSKLDTVRYKKALAALLLDVQRQIFAYEEQLQRPVPGALLDEVTRFFADRLFVAMPAGFDALPDAQRQAALLRLLHRPIRVCGMVKNEGEPGGGPFWVRQPDGACSLQIAESSQIDMQNPAQAAIARSATHFNPVDLVCALRDFRGRKFDLMAFRDENTGFISRKSKDGRDLKAQELPGLWNGAMADWNTLFVEVPVSTFNPVKTVNDLLRPQHQ